MIAIRRLFARQVAIIEAANEWLVDRHPTDSAEIALAIALAEAFPARLQTKSTCTCADRAICDECPDSPRQVIAGLKKALARRKAEDAARVLNIAERAGT